ncbi:hypothetical protein GQR36_00405 [Enterococcus termitis]
MPPVCPPPVVPPPAEPPPVEPLEPPPVEAHLHRLYLVQVHMGCSLLAHHYL